MIPSGQSRRDRWRNALAHRISNFALNRIATPWYRDMVDGAVRYGMASAAYDSENGERIVFDHIRGEVRRERG